MPTSVECGLCGHCIAKGIRWAAELSELERELAELIQKQIDMKESNDVMRQFNTPRRYSPQMLKAGRSQISRVRAKIAKLNKTT